MVTTGKRLLLVILLALLMGAKPVNELDKASAKQAAVDVEASSSAMQKKLNNASTANVSMSAEMKNRGEQLARDPVFTAAEKRSETVMTQAELLGNTAKATSDAKLMDMMQNGNGLLKIDQFMEEVEGQKPVVLAKYRVFVSRSMPASQMKSVLQQASLHPDMVVVIRGLLPGEKIDAAVRWIVSTGNISKDDPPPNVSLDPMAFRNGKITEVPVIQRLDANGNPLAWVRGSASVRFIDDEVANGKKGDLGKIGQVSKVIERDMIEVAKESVDIEKMESSAKDRFKSYWQRQAMYNIPTATEKRKRFVDPSVVLEDGITGPDGTVLAYPGERLNPMDALPFTMVFIVINATDKKQVVWAAGLIKRLGLREVMVSTTNMPKSDNWDFYVKTVVTLKRPLYVVNESIIKSFDIQKVPSMVVDGGNKRLAVYEYPMQ